MTVTAKSSRSFHAEERYFKLASFEQSILFGYFITIILLGNAQLKRLLPNKLFSNVRPQKHKRTLFCCFRYRIQINDEFVENVLLTVNFAINLFLLLATYTRDFSALEY